jgi:hypothetical protein
LPRRQPLKVRLRRRARNLIHRIRRPRRVTCLDCGFLSFGEAEATKEDRVMLAARVGLAGRNVEVSPSISLDTIRCFRSRWIDYAVFGGDDDSILRELAMDRRGCPDFGTHRRGFSPKEHKDQLLKRWESRRQFFLTVLGSAVGSLLALLVAWLTWRLGIK